MPQIADRLKCIEQRKRTSVQPPVLYLTHFKMMIILVGWTIICIELYLVMQRLQGVGKNILRGVSDTCGWLLYMCVSESNSITPNAACLICWPFILSGLLLQPFMSYCPNNGHLERCHTRCLSLSTLSI